jgi:DOPA 4,5-dioxygenase
MALPYARSYHHYMLFSQLQPVIRIDIYFFQNNPESAHEALALRDAVLRLRRDGAFVAVPLFRVNEGPIGPHLIGSYEIWTPAETFSSVFSYLSQFRGNLR